MSGPVGQHVSGHLTDNRGRRLPAFRVSVSLSNLAPDPSGASFWPMAAAADMRYMQRMPKSTVERVRERRDKLRAAGLRPVQIWLPDTTAPGFADDAARQARSLTEREASPAGRQEMAFWDALAAEAWDDEPD